MRAVARKPLGRAHSPTAANPLTFSVLSRQPTLADGAQRTLTECAETTERADTPTTERALFDRAKAHAADVAAEYFPDQSVEAIVAKNSIVSINSKWKAVLAPLFERRVRADRCIGRLDLVAHRQHL